MPDTPNTRAPAEHRCDVETNETGCLHSEVHRGSCGYTSVRPAPAESLQDRVQPWMLECFGAEIAADRVERCDRFIEEAFELVQSLGYDRERVLALADYSFNRSTGEPLQEVGGVMVTLAALCLATGLDMREAGETELARINVPETIAKIRAKQAAKPTGSALLVATLPPPSSELVSELRGAAKAIREHVPDDDGSFVAVAVRKADPATRTVAGSLHADLLDQAAARIEAGDRRIGEAERVIAPFAEAYRQARAVADIGPMIEAARRRLLLDNFRAAAAFLSRGEQGE